MEGDYSVRVDRVAFALLGVQLLLHLTQLGYHTLSHLVAFGYDAFLVMWSAILIKRLGRGLFALFPLAWLLAAYPLLLTEFIAFPVNPLSADTQTVELFLKDVFHRSGLVALGLSTAAGLLAWRMDFPLPRRGRRVGVVVLSTLCGLGIVAALILPVTVPQPLVFGVVDSVKEAVWGGRRLVPPPRPPREVSLAPSNSPMLEGEEFRYDHVVVIVMETVSTEDFERRFLAIKDGFFSQVRDRAFLFRNYYTTNLDSYTSLLAMLTSQQVPYRAYHTPEQFQGINQAPNLVRTLKKEGYRTQFLCTAMHQPFVPVREEWDRLVEGVQIPNPQRWASLEVNPVEAGLEDRAALSELLAFVDEHPRALVLQEMVIGHSDRWISVTGMEQLKYYNDYLKELYSQLDRAKTLLVVVADHGKRDDAALPENYHVPLLVVGNGVRPGVDEEFRNHLDFQGILAHWLCGGPLPPPRDEILLIGHTGRWSYGVLTVAGDYLFLDAFRGTAMGARGALKPDSVWSRFQEALDRFSVLQ